jgi:hypothetical protein
MLLSTLSEQLVSPQVAALAQSGSAQSTSVSPSSSKLLLQFSAGGVPPQTVAALQAGSAQSTNVLALSSTRLSQISGGSSVMPEQELKAAVQAEEFPQSTNAARQEAQPVPKPPVAKQSLMAA